MSGQANLKLPSGGTITIAGQDSASNFVTTLPANNGTAITTGSTGVVSQTMLAANVAGNGPAFSAYLSTTQSISAGAPTKVTFDTEIFDTNNNFASSKFTPTVAGYYQISSAVYFQSASTLVIYVFKNGNTYQELSRNASSGAATLSGGTVVYCNGSTDYLEIYAYSGASNVLGLSISTLVWVSGFLARSA